MVILMLFARPFLLILGRRWAWCSGVCLYVSLQK
ncbi:hypothetical protein [Salmonella phage vB_SenS_SB10]|uniref:Uncharacterized protein n=1 Tax=Salmonella phage vB_SenS_SB10 TaxID=2591134 RepID=A0A5J6TCT5_9CAUD|nr:hypothetical protein [Salmonella phage vB_SenS_SB10]